MKKEVKCLIDGNPAEKSENGPPCNHQYCYVFFETGELQKCRKCESSLSVSFWGSVHCPECEGHKYL